MIVLNKLLLGDQSRFVTHGGKAFRQVDKSSKLAAFVLVAYGLAATVLPIFAPRRRLALPLLVGRRSTSDPFTLDNFRTIFARPRAIDAGDQERASSLSLVAVAITLPLGFIAASLLRSGTTTASPRPRSTSSSRSRSASPP